MEQQNKKIQNRNLIIFISVFLILIISLFVIHHFALKEDYKTQINFVVAKKEINDKGRCDLSDSQDNPLPLESFKFFKTEVYVGDSIVKKSNSYLVLVYRKRNWKNYSDDDTYFVAKKIEIDN